MSAYLITGGAGFIGSSIARRLLEMGHSVRVLDDFSTGRRENIADIESKVELVVGDFCDPKVCDRCVGDVEVIFHVGAIPSVPRSVDHPRESHDANVNGTFNVLMAARRAGTKRVVYSASSSAYGDTPTLPKLESMRPAPLSPYAVSKLVGEYYCACFANVYGMETVALRYFNVFGPRQDPNSAYAAVIPAFVTRMLRGEPPIVFGDGEQSRDFCFIDNVINANLLAGGVLKADGQPAKMNGEVCNIACGERTTLNDIIAMINAELGTDIRAEYRDRRPGDVKDSLADISEARRVLGYQPEIMFAEGLRRTIAWYRKQQS
jgi:UDP-glucose 4-epimerase